MNFHFRKRNSVPPRSGVEIWTLVVPQGSWEAGEEVRGQQMDKQVTRDSFSEDRGN